VAQKAKGKTQPITYPGFLHLPKAVTGHPDFISLSPWACKLLIDIGQQYNGRNNGDLCASMGLMRNRGWTSNDMLTKATRELVNREWIFQTKQGGMRIGPTLYALTWQPINYCGGKLDVESTTKAPRSFK
jgi:hypothetical protein